MKESDAHPYKRVASPLAVGSQFFHGVCVCCSLNLVPDGAMRFMFFEFTVLLYAIVTSLVSALPSPTKAIGDYLRARSDASPNPIASQYPNRPTGIIAGTVAVIPIPYHLARSIIPSEYGILTSAYESMLPGFPKDSYPLVVKAIVDEDVGTHGFKLIPDFQSLHIFYPFVDLLGDGYSSFTYKPYLFVTRTSIVPILASSAYGTSTIPSRFDPPTGAYAYNETSSTTYMNVYTGLFKKQIAVSTNFVEQQSVGPWPFDFYVNVTNQPMFGSGSSCNLQTAYHNTTLSAEKVGVKGSISIAAPYLPTDSIFTGVYGMRTTIGFIEDGYKDCASLKGYSYSEDQASLTDVIEKAGGLDSEIRLDWKDL